MKLNIPIIIWHNYFELARVLKTTGRVHKGAVKWLNRGRNFALVMF